MALLPFEFNMKRLIDEVIKEIKPSREEEATVSASVKTVLDRINKGLKNANAVLGGSGAKGTWLKGLHDTDIFVRFDYDVYKDKSMQLSDILQKSIGKHFKNIKRLHGSRDYFQSKEGNVTFEIIPILNIKKAEQAKNITDISPLHAEWVNQHKNLKDDIRLTKQFCKASRVYGAESYIRGFSGYICEILTIHCGGFLNLVRKAAKWKDKVIIDASNFYKGKDVLMEMNKSKTHSPLVLVDPVQAGRNAAAALSKEKFERFRLWCRNFLKNPSKKYFVEKKITIPDLIKKAGKNEMILLDVKSKEGKEDVIGAKLLKVLTYLRNALEDKDFRVYGYGWEWDKEKEALFYFIVDREILPETKKMTGPPVKIKMHTNLFKKKHKKTFVEGKMIYANVKREFRRAEDLIKVLIKEEYVKERVKSVSIIDVE